MSYWKRGSTLSPALQDEVKRKFVNRFTGEHRPAWANQPRQDGRPYPVQFKDDADWLNGTLFHITDAGKLHKRSGCQSSPTWPDGRE